MQFLDLKSQLKDFPLFSIKDVEKVDVSFHKQRLSEWQRKGYVKKIRQGFYMFADRVMNEQLLFTIANRIHAPSYISLEMALSLYGLIPETVYGITSVTSQKTKTMKTPVGNFIYRHVRPKLLFGYTVRTQNGSSFQIAEMEKAVLDYLYFNAKIVDEESFKGLRFNAVEFRANAHMEKFQRFLTAFNSKALTQRTRKFLSYIEHAES